VTLSFLHGHDGFTTITLTDGFTFGDHATFRQAYESNTHASPHFLLDLAEVYYMDSAALGLLLTLREYVGKRRGAIRIRHAQSDVLQVLRIVHFEQLMQIDGLEPAQ
jgi:HptB-dependent secretion and biofilm anti anti-sigma factor